MQDKIEPSYGWAVAVKWRNAPGWRLFDSLYTTRSAAIDNYSSYWTNPNTYRNEHRKGLVKCIRVKMVPA